jgi:hypothetical protein
MQTRDHVWRTVLLLLAFGAAGACGAAADPLPSASPEPVLPDPAPNNKAYFPPASATAGSADPGHELNSLAPSGAHASGCNALNPCALPPPPLEHVQTVHPPRLAAVSPPG